MTKQSRPYGEIATLPTVARNDRTGFLDSLYYSMTNDEILGPKETAEYLKVSYRTIQRLVQAGKLPAFKVGRQLRFHRSDLETYARKKIHPRGLHYERPSFYRLGVIDRYLARKDIWYVRDEGFHGRLGLRKDYLYKMGMDGHPERAGKFAELHYRKVRLENGEMVIMLEPKEKKKIPSSEATHWQKFIIFPPPLDYA